MSFYGSVYYQLIDTFYKVVIQNKGDKTFTFNPNPINPSNTPSEEIIQSEAIGRKGVISLDSGNYWINFGKSGEATGMAPYTIWHSPANPDGKNPIIGMKYRTDIAVDEDGNPTNKNLKYTQLSDHDFIETYDTVYDEAGHIVDGKTTTHLYRLPKADVNKRVEDLENLVGDPPAIYPEGIENLYDYAEAHHQDIATLEEYVGDWPANSNSYSYNKKSISQFIGSLDKMFGNNFYSYSSKHNLSTIIGDMVTLWTYYHNTGRYESNPTKAEKSIVELLLDLKQAYDKYTSSNDGAVANLQTDINDLETMIDFKSSNGLGAVYPELNNLKAKDAEIDEALANLDNKINNAQSALNKSIGDLETSLTDNYEDADAALKSEITNAYQNDDNTLKQTLETGYTDAVAALKTQLTNGSDAASLQGQINTLNTNYQNADSLLQTSISALQNADSLINNRITNVDNFHKENHGKVLLEIEANEENISKLSSALGTTTETKTAFELIAENTTNISNINTKLGNSIDVESGTIYGDINTMRTSHTADILEINTQITNINGQLSTKVASTDLENYVHVDTLGNIDSWNENDTIALKLENIESVVGEKPEEWTDEDNIISKVELLEQSLTAVNEVVGKAEDLEGQTIINLLNQALKDIEGIKTAIKTLHPEYDGFDEPNDDLTEPTPDDEGESQE